jgi:hypothetical protein
MHEFVANWKQRTNCRRTYTNQPVIFKTIDHHIFLESLHLAENKTMNVISIHVT